MRVRDIMTTPVTCRPDSSVQEIAWLMASEDRQAVVVVERYTDDVVGIVTASDLIRRAVAWGVDLSATRAEDVMSKLVLTVSLDASAGSCAAKMRQRRVCQLPVVNETGRCCGIVSASDLHRGQILEAGGDDNAPGTPRLGLAALERR